MKKLSQLFEKIDNNKFMNLIIFLALGVILLIFSNTILKQDNKNSKPNIIQNIDPVINYNEFEKNLEKRLEMTLSKIEGVGEVEVMLTMEQSSEIVISKDVTIDIAKTNEVDQEGGKREIVNERTDVKNITITENGVEKPIILKEIEPKILGVIIVAEGGNDALVKDALTKSAIAVLGVQAHKIQILKMK